jgi:hypothetical protein
VFCAAVATFDTLVYGGLLRSGYRPGEITFSLSAVSANLRSMPTHLIQAMPLVLTRRAGGHRPAVVARPPSGRRERRRLGGPCRRSRAGCLLGRHLGPVRDLYMDHASGLSTLQSARFYVPALGPIALLGAWLLVRVPRKQPPVAMITLLSVGTLFWLGAQAFHAMYQSPFVDAQLSDLVRTFHS